MASKNETGQAMELTIQPKLAKIEREGQELLAQVRAINIITREDYEATGNMRQVLKAKRTALEEFIGPIKAAQYAAWKVTCGQEARVDGPLEQADRMLVGKRTAYTAELEQLRQQDLARLRREAEEKERERLAEEAMERAQAGDVEGAMEMLEEPVHVSSAVIMEQVEVVAKQQGFSERKTWSAEVVDLRALVQAVHMGLAPIECLQADMKFLNKQASAFRGGLSIPGVKAVSKVSESVRGV